MKRVDVVSALIFDDTGKLLTVRNIDRETYHWGLPGGAVEDGETLEQALIREVQEETGLHVAITGLSSLREMFFSERQHHALITTFYAKVVGGVLSINDPDNDIAEVKWIDRQTAKELMPALFELLKLESDVDKTLAFYAYEGTK